MSRRILKRVGMIVSLAVAGATGGCSYFPAQGPYTVDVVSAKHADPDKVQYVLIQTTPAILAQTQTYSPPSLGQILRDRRPPPVLNLGIGDIVGVTIFEAAAGGLFIPQEAGARAGNFVAIPNQEIDNAGFIAVPYAGQVPAADRTLKQVQATIEERLRNRAIEPQAVVTLVEGRSNQVSVTGEVNVSIRFPITKAGDKLLDAVARAGGPKYPAYESYLTLKRGARVYKVYLNDIVSNKSNNVYLQPGDTIVVSREFRSFMALGATGQNGQFNFDNETLTFAQAMGKSGAILDARGDPEDTFLYRLEPKALVAAMGYDVTPYITPMVPVIYRFNMREPDGFFLASKFQMRDQDVIFVSNSIIADVTKFLVLVNLGANTLESADIARIAIKGGRR